MASLSRSLHRTFGEPYKENQVLIRTLGAEPLKQVPWIGGLGADPAHSVPGQVGPGQATGPDRDPVAACLTPPTRVCSKVDTLLLLFLGEQTLLSLGTLSQLSRSRHTDQKALPA